MLPLPARAQADLESAPLLPSPSQKFAGEYGLWVEQKPGEVAVHWITAPQGSPAEADSGFLEVFREDQLIYRAKTPPGPAHRAAFPYWEKRDLRIRYGGLTSPLDKHETTLYFSKDPAKSQVQFDKVDSVFVIGDVHGQYDNLVRLLANAKLIDANRSWQARRAHLVLLGDLFDRGDDVTQCLWFLYRLEREAEARGGKVHVMLGNHEIMAFLNDLRYTSEKEKLIAQYHQTGYTAMFHVRESVLGRWLASKPALIKINNILLAHGGVSPPFTAFTLQSFNDSLYAFLQEEEFPSLLQEGVATVRGDATLYARRLYFFFGDNSIFWQRGYIMSDTLKNDLKKTLDRFKAKYHVVAHTPVTRIQTFYGGKVFAVDLHNPATEMLLIISNPYRDKIYRCLLEGKPEPLF